MFVKIGIVSIFLIIAQPYRNLYRYENENKAVLYITHDTSAIYELNMTTKQAHRYWFKKQFLSVLSRNRALDIKSGLITEDLVNMDPLHFVRLEFYFKCFEQIQIWREFHM